MTEIPRPKGVRSDEPASRLDFEIEVGDGTGRLLLRPRAFFGGLKVERLELEIPNVCFPLDISGGLKVFKGHRCRVLSAAFSLDDRALEGLLDERRRALAGAGFDEVHIRLLDGMAEVGGRARVAERTADFTAHLHIEASERGFRLVMADLHLFGYLRRPAPLLGHDLLCLLVGAAPSGGGAAKAEAGEADAAQVHGLADVVVRPLDLFVWRMFPAAGWRLPDAGAARVVECVVRRDRAEIRYDLGEGAAEPDRAGRAAALADAAGRCRDADAALLRGDLEGAAALYRGELQRRPQDGPFLTERLLGVLCGRDATLRDAERVARDALARWPELVGAHLALAAAATARGRGGDAADAFDRVLQVAEGAGDDEDAVRAALAAARASSELDPRRSAALYERVLERRSGHVEANAALAERYAADQRWPDLIRLLRRRIAGSADRREQAAAHLKLGEIYETQLADPARARRELERAVELEGNDLKAWEALTRVVSAAGDAAATLKALDRIAVLHEAKRDTVGEARTQIRIAGMLEAAGDDARAQAAYHRALELVPEDPELLERSARVAARRGRDAEAVAFWDRLVETCPVGDDRRLRAERALALLLVESGDLEAARRHLLCAGELDAEGLVTLATIEEKAGRPADAARALGDAAARVGGIRAAELELRAARHLAGLSRDDDAAAAFERAAQAAPGAEPAVAAARELVELARDAGDRAAEARWLDAVLSAAGPAADRAALARRRAELHLAAGEAAAANRWLDESLAAGADPAAARRLRADVLGGLGDHRAQAELLETLADEAADAAERARLWAAAVPARAAAGDRDEALELARRAAALRPDDPEVRQALGEAAWHARLWDDVVAFYSVAVEARPTAEAARRLGVALERQGRAADALRAYATAAAAPDAAGEALAAVLRAAADLQERQGDPGAAVATLRAAAAETRTAESPAGRAELLERAGDLAWRRLGDHAAAVACLEEALRVAPGHGAALDALEALHADTGDRAALAELLGRRLLLAGADRARQQAVLERLAELLGGGEAGSEAARDVWRRVLTVDPGCRPALRWLAADAARQGDGALAESYTARLAEPADDADPAERAEALATLAAMARDAGRLDEAEQHLREALELAGPEHRGEVLVALEELYEHGERWPELVDVLALRAGTVADEAARLGLETRRARAILERLGDARAALELCREQLHQGVADPRWIQLLYDAACAADDPGEQADGALRLADLAEDPVDKGARMVEAAELYRTRLGDPDRARFLYREVLGRPPGEVLEIARRLASPVMARKLAERVVERFDTAEGRAEAHRFAADKARESDNTAALEEHLAALLKEGCATVRELGRLAALLGHDRPAEAAPVLAAALQAHARELDEHGERLGDTGRELLVDLRGAARAVGDDVGDDVRRQVARALADGLVAAASVETDRQVACAWLRDAAAIRRERGEDAAGTADALARALELAVRPDERRTLLEELAKLWTGVLGDPARGEAYLMQARRLSGPMPAAAPPAAEPPAPVAPLAATPSVRTIVSPPPAAPRRASGRVAALQEELAHLPAREVERKRAVRLQIAAQCLEDGDGAAARDQYEIVLSDDPGCTAALAPLIDLYSRAGEWARAADALERLARLAPADGEKAELLFRAGEIRLLSLGDEEAASDAYLKAADLDPTHAPALRRLVDYYWALCDDESLAGVASDLEAAGGLTTGTAPETLARVAVSAALTGDAARALRLARALGPGGASAVAAALAEAAGRKSCLLDGLLEAARVVCRPPGPLPGDVRAALGRWARNPLVAQLAARI